MILSLVYKVRRQESLVGSGIKKWNRKNILNICINDINVYLNFQKSSIKASVFLLQVQAQTIISMNADLCPSLWIIITIIIVIIVNECRGPLNSRFIIDVVHNEIACIYIYLWIPRLDVALGEHMTGWDLEIEVNCLSNILILAITFIRLDTEQILIVMINYLSFMPRSKWCWIDRSAHAFIFFFNSLDQTEIDYEFMTLSEPVRWSSSSK